MTFEETNREATLHERVNRFKDEGYRGFSPAGGRGRMEGSVKVRARNAKGTELNAEGETLDEAYENLIELIDITLDS
jgi:hypothetical protein